MASMGLTEVINTLAAPYRILTTDGKMHDIDGEDSERWQVTGIHKGLLANSYFIHIKV